ncbi:hypothetical protein [Actinoplanes sp. NPDC026670]|uniref:hypothetical protein n=1 Tax=Actinoplanes sp. NPDC026670 TaxID=3154700 RepID=UPI0033D9C79A
MVIDDERRNRRGRTISTETGNDHRAVSAGESGTGAIMVAGRPVKPEPEPE